MATRSLLTMGACALALMSTGLQACSSDDQNAAEEGGASATSGTTNAAGRAGSRATGGQAQGGVNPTGATGGIAGTQNAAGGVVVGSSSGGSPATGGTNIASGGTPPSGGTMALVGGSSSTVGAAGSMATGGVAIGEGGVGTSAASGSGGSSGNSSASNVPLGGALNPSGGATSSAAGATSIGEAGQPGNAAGSTGDGGAAGATAIGGAAGTSDTTAVCQGLSNYYRLDEGIGTTAHDSIGISNGALQKDPAWTTGKMGFALDFDGTNYVRIADSDALDPGIDDFSVEAWVKLDSGDNGHRRIVAHGSHGYGGWDGWSLMQWCGGWGDASCGSMVFLVGADHIGEWYVGTCSSMADGQWHHYAATVNRKGSMRLAVDGAFVASPCSGVAASANWGSGGAADISVLDGVDLNCPCDLCLGASCEVEGACPSAGTSEPFNGTIDEVAIYHRALVLEEIGLHHNDGSGRNACEVPACRNGVLDPNETDIDCGGACSTRCRLGQACNENSDCASANCYAGSCLSVPIAHYALDETTGTVVADSVGGHDGVRFGGTVQLDSGCRRGGCLELGGNGTVQVVAPTWLPLGNAPRSVALWVNPGIDLVSQTESSMVQYGTPANAQMFGLITSANAPGHLYFYGHNYDSYSSQLLTQDSWQHVAVTYDGTTLRLYVDGQPGATASVGLDTQLNADGLTLGLRPPTTYFTGMIDDVLIFDVALTQEEVFALAQ